MDIEPQRGNHPALASATVQVPLKRRAGQIVAHALIDAVDAPLIHRWPWRLSNHGYAARSETADGKKRTIYLHREILGAEVGTIVDHINGDRLDNRRANLRSASASQNNANAKDRPRRSGYRGVYPHKPSGRWLAQISVDGHVCHLGLFEAVEDAARAYDVAARRHWGPFARTNGFA